MHVGLEVTTEMIHHLMDGVDPEIPNEAVAIATKMENVMSASARARWTGRSLIVEIDALFNASITFEEVRATSRQIESEVLQKIPGARMITIAPRLDRK